MAAETAISNKRLQISQFIAST